MKYRSSSTYIGVIPREAYFTLDILQTKNAFNSSNLPDIKLHLAHLKHAQTTYIHLHLGKIISYNIPYNGVFNISCNLLNTELKVKKRNVCVGTECLQVYWLFTLMITWLTGSCARTTAQHPERGPSCVSLAQEKIQIQNYKYAFY